MQPKELFTVAVRTIGVFTLVTGVTGLVDAITVGRGPLVFRALAHAGIGFAFLSRTSWITSWCYQLDKSGSQDPPLVD